MLVSVRVKPLTPGWRGAKVVSRTRSAASPGSSRIRCFVPGRAHLGWAAPPSQLPTCVRMFPSLSVMWSTATATTRWTSPWPVSSSVHRSCWISPFSLSSCCRLQNQTVRASTEYDAMPISSRSSMLMETMISLQSANGTSKSVGHDALGGIAEARRAWKLWAYSSMRCLITKCSCRVLMSSSGLIAMSSQAHLASRVPTCDQCVQRAASHSQVPTSTDSSVVRSTFEDAGYCV
mmetsp:Transcript_107627/g.347340  ORF Transcript_107627/g.347340 Transcript_107627/m.347340 type:complete len:234 (+) Transcript_107627:457-1158(+)